MRNIAIHTYQATLLQEILSLSQGVRFLTGKNIMKLYILMDCQKVIFGFGITKAKTKRRNRP